MEEMLQRGAVIIDVRSKEEFRMGHVLDSINMPLDTLAANIQKVSELKKPVVLCCASGMRSGRAQSILQQAGIECCNGGGWQSVANKLR